jgi:hypothetical protein
VGVNPTPEEFQEHLRALLAEKTRRKKTFDSLEALLTDPKLFGLTTATPVQRAICRIADGVPLGELQDDPVIMDAVGDCTPISGIRPRELAILSGIRVGKSLIASLLAIYWTQVCDVSKLGPGEIPRISIVSITRDLAEVVFGHVLGRIAASKALTSLVIGNPAGETITLRHPTGTPVEICVVSGSRAGSSLVARWSAGCIFDEFPRMLGADESVINWEDSRRAVLERILPNAQMVSIGSPWAPYGPAFDVYSNHWRHPSAEMVVVKTPAWNFNPHFWTPERVEKAKANPDIYQTDVLAEFANPEESLFATHEVDSCTRQTTTSLKPNPNLAYRAAMDPATRGNGWTLVIVTRQGARKIVAHVEEWRGSKVDPLSPKWVMGEISAICKEYGITSIDTDIYMADAIKDLARDVGIHLRQVSLTDRERSRRYMSIKAKMAIGEIELSPDRKFRNDLLQLKKKTTSNGIKVYLPATPDGRHCDYAPSLMLAMAGYLEDAKTDELDPMSEQSLQAQANEMRNQRYELVKSRFERPNIHNRWKLK